MKNKLGEGKQLVIMNFTGIYEKESFHNGCKFLWLDLKEIQGTNCYCDEVAEAEIRKRMGEVGARGLHFLDSGNYHYVSKLWLDLVETDFELLVFDHHTDMQKPMFGDILSCGGWIKAALDQNTRLKRVWLAGPPAEGVKEAETLGWGDRVVYISEKELEAGKWQEQMGKNSLPLYISVDKDVLWEEDARTNWDQGTVSLQTLIRSIREAARIRSVIGMDVCGESPETEEQNGAECQIVNDRTNKALLALFLEMTASEEK